MKKLILSVLCFLLLLSTASCAGKEDMVDDAEKMAGFLGLTMNEIAEKTGEKIITAFHVGEFEMAEPRSFFGCNYTLSMGTAMGEFSDAPVGGGKTANMTPNSLCNFLYEAEVKSPEDSDIKSLAALVKRLGEGYGATVGDVIDFNKYGVKAAGAEELGESIKKAADCYYMDDWYVDEPLRLRFFAKYTAADDTLVISARYSLFLPPKLP